MNRLPPLSSLMSPPESTPFDSFSSKDHSLSKPVGFNDPTSFSDSQPSSTLQLPPLSQIRQEKMSLPNMKSLLSPPISPAVKNDQEVGNKQQGPGTNMGNEDGRNTQVQDPVLYADNDASTEISEGERFFAPLEPQVQPAPIEPTIQRDDQAMNDVLHKRINRHMATTKSMAWYAEMKKVHSSDLPTYDEYRLVATVASTYNKNPQAYYQRERDTFDRIFTRDNAIQTSGSRQKAQDEKSTSTLRRIAPAPTRTADTPKGAKTPAARVTKSKPPTSKLTKSNPRPHRTKPSPQLKKALDSFVATSPSPKPARVIGANRDHTSFRSLPDYCPPVDTLGNNHNALKVDWKGGVLDLSNDPDRDELHPAELKLASCLRLDCNLYLATKRRFFAERVRLLKTGKEDFRKTNAQGACNIDVNKASRLWTAYEKVGWLDRKWFEEFL
ncbi:MAG: hypothetical protein M1834_008433 [Cirrosporium novae-zelandiae]|nr:MAG: hypothetical protein M1834_008433 [Cirrosporium novae-zelandiae]